MENALNLASHFPRMKTLLPSRSRNSRCLEEREKKDEVAFASTLPSFEVALHRISHNSSGAIKRRETMKEKKLTERPVA